MSSLWEHFFSLKQTIRHKRPSPKYNNYTSNLAQGLLSGLDRKKPLFFHKSEFIKRICLLISRKGKVEGSMTVEAAIVLPLFLFFFLNLSCAMEMIRLHANLELALWEVGNRLTVYGTAVSEGASIWQESSDEAGDTWWNELAGIVISYTYVKAQIIEYLGREYLEASPLAYGTDGLQFVESNIWETDDEFEIVLTYAVSPFSSVAGYRSFRMSNHYYGHIWNGYGLSLQGEEEEYVYITQHGTVYHLNRDCTHLSLSVRETSKQEALHSRNNQGERYGSCEKCCQEEQQETVFITETGECYHNNRNCSGLKRIVICIPISEAENYGRCSRCAGER